MVAKIPAIHWAFGTHLTPELPGLNVSRRHPEPGHKSASG
jgi:hypothetical protein